MPASRRSVMFSLPPLWLIGLCLFLPTVRSCEKMQSPAAFLAEGKAFFFALLAPYVVAQLLVILAVVALARGQLPRWIERASAALVVVAGASATLLAVLGLDGRNATEVAWSLFAGVCVLAAVAVLWRARRLPPWTRLSHFFAAYTIFTLPLGCLLLRMRVEDGAHKVGYGAYLFLAALSALVAVHARTLARSRDPVSSSAA